MGERRQELPKKLFIFDWNGTLQDDLNHIYECGVQRIFRKFGLPCPDIDSYRNQVTSDFMESFYWPNGISRDVTSDDLNRIMSRGFIEKGVHPKLFHDARSVLKEINSLGHTVMLVSAFGQIGLSEAVARHGLRGMFDGVFGGVTDKASMFANIMKLFMYYPDETVCVGDMVGDVLDASKAKALPVACPNGFHSLDRLESVRNQVPNLVIVSDLTGVLNFAR